MHWVIHLVLPLVCIWNDQIFIYHILVHSIVNVMICSIVVIHVFASIVPLVPRWKNQWVYHVGWDAVAPISVLHVTFNVYIIVLGVLIVVMMVAFLSQLIAVCVFSLSVLLDLSI